MQYVYVDDCAKFLLYQWPVVASFIAQNSFVKRCVGFGMHMK